MNCKNIVLMGKSNLAVNAAFFLLRHQGIENFILVPSLPHPDWTMSLSFINDHHNTDIITYIESGDYRDIPDDIEIDLAISIFYGKIIKKDFIDRCKKIINLHNSPLPLYRGVRPINWALKDGRTEHGVTIHEIDEGIDTGPIISQLKYSIYPEHDEVFDVYLRAQQYGLALFENTIPMLDKIEPQPQDNSKAIYHSSRDDKLLGDRLDFSRKDV